MSLELTPSVRALQWLVTSVGIRPIIESSWERSSAPSRWACGALFRNWVAFDSRARPDSDLKPSKWHSPTIVSAVAFAAFSAVHLIDDFLFDVPLEFHLSVPFTLLLALAFMAALIGLVAAAASRSPTGYLGLAIAGLLIALAQLLKSAPEMLQPGPWHAGLASELAAIGLGASAAVTALVSFLAWRTSSRPSGVAPQ